ncbi:MAG: glycine cleavage system protein GcvH [Desulfamplus sp.]|nr:glycine cleavage system protein GcvH [Desulfamplus sp.]
MKEITELNLPENLKYSDSHEWAGVEGDVVTIGIDDYAQDQLGEVVFVEVPEVGATFSKGDQFGTVESVKAVSEIYTPVSGEVVAVNESLADAPELVNNSPYENGWIMKVKANDLSALASELKNLKDKAAYLEMLKG